MRRNNKISGGIVLSGVLVLSLLFSGCIKKIALKKVAGALTADGGTVFSGDDDPQLVADALPFALKTYESLLQSLPDDPKLLFATGKAFCMYAYAFVHVPADTISDTRITEKIEHLLRAKKLYLRSKKYLLKAIELQHPGFNTLINADKTDSALMRISLQDSALLYWAGAAWMGAFTADKFDMTLAVDMPKPVAFMNRLLALNEAYGNGSVHDFFISYYGGMPQSMGGSEKKAREHFKRSVELSKGESTAPYLALATSVCISKQYVQEFKDLLAQVCAVDADKNVPNRLAATINQKKARWLLDHIDNYFLPEEETGNIQENNE